MEQITREEMIELLKDGELLAEVTGNIDLARRYGPAIAALQAAEPAMVVDIRRDLRDGSPSPRILKFTDLGDGEHQLFTLPCPPAKAQADLVWCGCGDGYPDDSYGAAYIDIFGHCENCHMGSETADPAAQVESWAGGFRINPMGNIERLRDGMFLYSCPNLPYEAQGWKLVPIEPTPDMTLQGALAGVEHGNGEFSQIGAEAVYKAMLTASPAPDREDAQQPQGGEDD